MIKKRVVKRTVRKTTTRAKAGRWSILGLVHGGKEGKQWSRAKRITSEATASLKVARHGIKVQAMQKIAKMGKLSKDDKMRLINEIDRM
jgi:hypothetical protein